MKKSISLILAVLLCFGIIIPNTVPVVNAESGTNIIEDPSLEVGSALFYNFENSEIVQDVGNAHSGEYAIRMGSDSESAGGVAQVSTQSMTPGKTYKASLWGKTADGFATMGVVCYDSTSVDKSPFGEGILLAVGVDGQSFTSSYEEMSVTFTVPEGTVEVGLAFYKHGSIGFAYFDDFTLEEVVEEPEPPVPTNLIENPSLEGSGGLFYDFGVSVIVQDADNAHSGEYAVRMGSDSESTGGAAQVSTRSMIPGKTYKASVWGKTPSGTAYLVVNCYDETSADKSPFGGGILLTTARQSTSSSSYKEMSITFTVPEDTVEVGLTVWKEGIIGFAYFDDFSLEEVVEEPEPPMPDSNVNLLTNPGVEDEGDWENLWESVRLNDQNHAHSGNYSLRVGKAGGTGRAGMYVYDSFTPGATYIASVWGKSDSVNSATLRVECRDSALDTLLNVKADSYFTSSYEKKSIKFTVPEDTFGIAILVSKESQDSDFAYFDDFSLVEVVSDYYVATDGSDENSGSITKPFATIDKARSVIREVKKYNALPSGQITVNIRGGVYPVSRTINWTAADSGSEENPIVYKAYNNEKVTFMGGKIIPGSEAVPVTDENILNRILDPLARERVKQIDLGALGIEDIPAIKDHGYAAGDDYMPLDVYVDGEALTLARWPNKEPDDAYIKINRKISDDGSTFSFGYHDPTKHTEKWDVSKLEDLHVKGYIANDWAGASHKLASIDVANKTVKSVGRAPWGITLGQRFYFYNLIEEIDVPGESYIDRQNKILYFYPRGNVDNAIVTVSTLANVMFALNGVENVTFEGLNFDTTRNVMLQVRDGKNVIIDGCVFARGSRYAIDLDGKNCVLRNNHIYDMARGGVFVSGGNWLELIPGENLIENNRIHSFNRHYNSSIPAIQIDGNNHTIRNNEIYDSTDMSILLSTGVDHVVEYNEIYNGVQQASDMGAIYWGRRPLQMGYVIRYNYFHDIGNNYDGIGQQSVFYDDGAIGPEMYGNIFYRGTRTLDQGGTIDNAVAFKGHGSQYALIKNNIFIDVPTAGRFMNWSSDGVKSDYWWLWAMDRWSNLQHDIWNNISPVLDNQKWIEYFENTDKKPGIRPNLPEIFTPEHYEFVSSKDPLANRDELIAYAKLNAPNNEIEFSNNVLIDVAFGNNDPSKPAYWGYAKNGTNYRSLEDPGFVEYGKDFKLTEAGLAKIRQTLPDFQNIPTEEIGLLSAVGGYEPSVSGLNIQGTFDIGDIISAKYTFDDQDGDREGPSDINWYVANEEDGEYERIPNKKGKELLLDVDCGGRYVRFGIAPYDTNLLYGQEVMSEPVFVNMTVEVDKTELRKAIAKAQELLANSEVGTLPGQYPLDAKIKVERVLETALEIDVNDKALQSRVNQVTEELSDIIEDFRLRKYVQVERMAINPFLRDPDSWIAAGLTMEAAEFEDGKLEFTAPFEVGGGLAYGNQQKGNKIYSFKYKTESYPDFDNGWAGFYFRSQDPKVQPYQTSSFFFIVKKDIIEFQMGKIIAVIGNEYIKEGEEHLIEVGCYDLDDDYIQILLLIDGVEVLRHTVHDPAHTLYGKDGYFGFIQYSNKITITPVYADKNILNDLINEATQLKENAVSGTEPGQYPQEAIDNLADAIAKAETVKMNETAVQFDVDNEAMLLEKAIEAFRNAMEPEDPGEDPGVGGGGSITPAPKLPVILNPSLDSNGVASAIISKEYFDFAMKEATVSEEGIKELIITVKEVEGAKSYALKLPAEAFLGIEKKESIIVDTAIGKIELPSDMFSNTNLEGAGSIVISIEVVDASVIEDADLKQKIGDKPIVEINAFIDGKQISWNNPNAPVTVSIPYTPTAEELTNPESIVILYIDGNGKAVSVPNGHYDPLTGTVIFSTTHFSHYAIAYVKAVFNDVATNAWYSKAVNFIAARSITAGTGNGNYSPDSNLTRGELIVLLMRTYGINPDVDPKDNFSDAGNTYYTGYLAAAKRLGLTQGIGNNKFAPDNQITRQEMFTLLFNALKLIDKLPKGTSGKTLSSFSDAGQISSWAKEASALLVETGMIVGDAGKLYPGSTTTRAEMAQLLYNFLSK